MAAQEKGAEKKNWGSQGNQEMTTKLTAMETAFCGGVSGIASRMVIAPFDVVKIRLQTQSHVTAEGVKIVPKYHGIVSSTRLIIQEEGFTGLWKGNVPALLLYMSYGAVQFATLREMELLLGSYSSDNHFKSGAVAFISGAIAGMTASIVTYPFDLLRTRFSLQGQTKTYTGMIQAVQHMMQHEGIKGFYAGAIPTVVQIIPYMGLMYYSYESLKSLLRTFNEVVLNNREDWLTRDIEKMLCGGAAGLISKTGTMPFDVIRKRLQAQSSSNIDYAVGRIEKYSSIRNCITKTYKQEGIKGFYRGLIPGLIKTAPASAVTFLVFEKTRDLLLYFHSQDSSL